MDNRRGDSPGRRREDLFLRELERVEETVQDLREEFKSLNASVHGDSENHDSVYTQLRRVEALAQKLDIVVLGNVNGQGGLKKRIEGMDFKLDVLADSVKSLGESKAKKWTDFSSVIIAFITSVALVLTNLDKVAIAATYSKSLFVKEAVTVESLQKEIEGLRETRGKEVEKMLKNLERARKGQPPIE